MKELADGLQYRVYDIGNHRVLKKCKTEREIKIKLISWGVILPRILREKTEEAITLRESSLKIISDKAEIIKANIVGNPKIFPNFDYEQDKVIPIEQYLHTHSIEENKIAIDGYIKNILETWKSGFSDVVFNFTLNNGIDSHGEAILIDLGELSSDKNEITSCIKNQKWLTQHSYTTLNNRELKSYFRNRMSSEITLENLNRYWPNTA